MGFFLIGIVVLWIVLLAFGKIFLGDRPLSVIDARDLSVTLPEAYLYFNRAKRQLDRKRCQTII